MAKSETGELEIQHAILELMLDGKVWTNADLKHRLKSILPLTPADKSVGERSNEALWEQRVNNALAPSRTSSLYAKGHVENCEAGHHCITDTGRKYITDDFDFDDLLGEFQAKFRAD